MKTAATNGANVMRIVLNNNTGCKVQVIAWQQNITKLEEIAESNNVSHND